MYFSVHMGACFRADLKIHEPILQILHCCPELPTMKTNIF